VHQVKQASRLQFQSRAISHQVVVVGLALTSALVVAVPIVMMIDVAIHPVKEMLRYPLLPSPTTFEYITQVATDKTYQRFFLNSSILAVSTVVLTLILSILAAYGFSRFKIKGGRVMLLGILALLMLPPVTLIIPYFRFAHLLRIYDTLAVLIVVNVAYLLPTTIWLLKGYLDSIPPELEEAALIDGCTVLQALRKVVVPLAVPGIIATGIFAFIRAWNEYLFALVLTETPSSQTLTIGLSMFFGHYIRDWNSIMALTTITSLPLMLIFVFFQRYVVQGMTSGAVK
jgi:multiple sugar transport system permease protein